VTTTPRPFVRTFDQAKPYEQKEPGDARFNWLIEKDELPGMCVGRVRLKGPIHKTPGAHDTWDQAYLIISGSGTIHLAGQSHRVNGPTIVVIPRNTWHSVELAAGESLEYAFINQYR
jgi:mannose-6-phosphate isomerase-like protein (cupin superfamily)